MFRHAAKVALVMMVLALTASFAIAQTNAAPGSHTITGCLQKGLEAGGFFLLTADNKHWEVYDGGNLPLADHVGQTVTLTGAPPTRTAAQEQASQPYEKKETGTRPHADFRASSLTVVGTTCGK